MMYDGYIEQIKKSVDNIYREALINELSTIYDFYFDDMTDAALVGFLEDKDIIVIKEGGELRYSDFTSSDFRYSVNAKMEPLKIKLYQRLRGR